MERYDYRNNAEMAGEVSAEIDTLNTKQLVEVHQTIQTIKTDAEADEKEQYKNWFRAAILPILKEFCELTSSCLEIEYREFIDVKLRNEFGLDVTESCRGLYMALLVASHIAINKEQDEVFLGLIYDPRKFIN